MRTAQAAVYSAIISLYIGCFYLAIGTLMTLTSNQSMAKFLFDFVVVMLALFGLLTFAIKELQEAFTKINQPRTNDSDSGVDSNKNQS